MSSFNTDHLNLKLDGLNLEDKRNISFHHPKPSLLSSSLANERTRPHEFQTDSFHGASHQLAPNQYQPRDHPEPELLATSVGKDLDGRLIPSSSTISLLSLNSQQHHHSPNLLAQQNTQFVTTTNVSPQMFQAGQFDEKKAIRSRNSITHLNQKRFESYQRLSSPTPQSQSPGPVSMDHSTSQSIPINSKLISPDSPNLDPTSLTGSPSRFWLSSQTPPRSLNNSFKRLSALSASQVQHLQAQVSNIAPVNIPTHRNGDDSPVLKPVQTPSEEQPMTPLYLSNGFQVASYFPPHGDHITEEDEEMNEE